MLTWNAEISFFSLGFVPFKMSVEHMLSEWTCDEFPKKVEIHWEDNGKLCGCECEFVTLKIKQKKSVKWFGCFLVCDVNLSGCVTLNVDICFDSNGFCSVPFFQSTSTISLLLKTWVPIYLLRWKAILLFLVMRLIPLQRRSALAILSGREKGAYFIQLQWVYRHWIFIWSNKKWDCVMKS